MEKRMTVFIIAGSVLFAATLVVLGVIIGRSLYEPKTVILNTNGDQSNSTNFLQADNTITVVGQSKLNVKPDVAKISFNIDICDKDAQRSNTLLNEKIASLRAGFQEIGLEKSEFVSTNFSYYPDYDYTTSSKRIIGFCSSNDFLITTTKLDKVSNIIDKAIELGSARIYYIQFTAKDIKAAHQEGIELAFQDAENQAKALAELMNVSIQEILSSNINILNDSQYYNADYGGGGGDISPQDDTLEINITVVYRVSK